MRRDLLTKPKNSIPGSPSVFIDHTCVLSPYGLLKDHFENVYECSEDLSQTAFGITGGSIDISPTVSSASNFSFQLSIKVEDLFSEFVPVSLGDGVTFRLHGGNLFIKDRGEEMISSFSGKDFSLNVRYDRGKLEVFLNGEKILTNTSSPPRKFSPSILFPSGVFMDFFFFYPYKISDQTQTSLLSSVFRKSSTEVIQAF